MDMKRFFLYAITIAALALAGCGGNGNGPSVADMNGDDNGTPATSTAAEMTVTDVIAALNAAGATLAPDASSAAILAAITALDGNQEMEDAVVGQLRMALGMPDADAAMILAAVQDLVAPTVDSNPAMTAAAKTKVKAIGAEMAQTTDAGLGGTAGTGYMLTLARDRMETKATIAIAGTDPDDDPQFEKAMDLTDGNGNGFPGSMHVRTMKEDDDGNVESEVVIVRTDIAVPIARPFVLDGANKGVYPLDTNLNADDEAQSLAIDMGNAGMVMSDAFVSGEGPTTVLTFLAEVEDTTSTADVDESVDAFETMATFNGAMGTLTCGGEANCTVTLNAKGEATDVSTGWQFTPAPGVTVDVADTSYLAYGFWLNRTSKDGVVTKYNEVETFAMAVGIPETGDTDFGNVTGTATYNGGAAGVYVKNVTDDAGAIVSATSGHFQADVELNASFGGGNVAANDQFTIEGTVTNFDLAGGEENDWGVKLGLTDLSGGRTDDGNPGESTPGSSHDNVFSGGVATGDSTAAAGSWSGEFRGSSALGDHDMDPDTAETRLQPIAVIGEFNANFTDGTVAGGYGANKE